MLRAGLPDGLFAQQKIPFLECLFLKALVCFITFWHFIAIRYILEPFGIFGIFYLFGMLYQEKFGKKNLVRKIW
jgi:hypothetical protein